MRPLAGYHADEYPVALFEAPDGRLLLAHCPADACRLDLEEAETGRRSPHHINASISCS